MKKFWIILGSTAVLLALTAGILLGTAKSRVIGTWEANVGYLETYRCDVRNCYEFRADGTFEQSIRDASTGGIQNIITGTWTMSGLEIHCQRSGAGRTTPFTYNPLTNTLNNGGGLIAKETDVIFHPSQE